MTGSRRDFLLGAGGAAAGAVAVGGPAIAGETGGVLLLVAHIAAGRGADETARARLRPGEAMDVALAPTDYDGRAVAVRAGGRCVGYVPPRRAEALASLLAAGYRADGVVREVRDGGPRPEVTVEIRLLA